MYVCVCKAVTERQIAKAAAEGVTRMRELRSQLGITTECNRCARCAHDCLRSAVAKQAQQQTTCRLHSLLFPQSAPIPQEAS